MGRKTTWAYVTFTIQDPPPVAGIRSLIGWRFPVYLRTPANPPPTNGPPMGRAPRPTATPSDRARSYRQTPRSVVAPTPLSSRDNPALSRVPSASVPTILLLPINFWPLLTMDLSTVRSTPPPDTELPSVLHASVQHPFGP